MRDRLFSVLTLLFILGIIFLPIVAIDIFIIKFMGGYYYSLAYLIIFLVIFYGLDLLLSICIDGILKVSEDFRLFKVSDIFCLFLELVGSYIVITILDKLFVSLDLSTVIKMSIVLIHTLLGYFIISRLRASNDLNISNENIELDKLIEKEVNYILEKENIITCINIIKEKYPDIPFNNIVESVRRIHNKKSSSS